MYPRNFPKVKKIFLDIFISGLVFNILWCASHTVVCFTYCGVFHILWCVSHTVVCFTYCGVLHILCFTYCGVLHMLWCASHSVFHNCGVLHMLWCASHTVFHIVWCVSHTVVCFTYCGEWHTSDVIKSQYTLLLGFVSWEKNPHLCLLLPPGIFRGVSLCSRFVQSNTGSFTHFFYVSRT